MLGVDTGWIFHDFTGYMGSRTTTFTAHRIVLEKAWADTQAASLIDGFDSERRERRTGFELILRGYGVYATIDEKTCQTVFFYDSKSFWL